MSTRQGKATPWQEETRHNSSSGQGCWERVCGKRRLRSTQSAKLLEVGLDDFDDVFRSFRSGLGILRHVIADMVFEKLAHQTID